MAMKDRHWHLWSAAVLFFVLRGSQAEIEVDISLEHSLDGETFTAAGTIQGSLSDQRRRIDGKLLATRDLKGSEQHQLQQLMETDRLYRLQLPSDPSDPGSQKIVTSLPARCLVGDDSLIERLVVHATKSGKFVGFNHDFSNYPCAPVSGNVRHPQDLQFPESSAVQVWLPAEVPILTKRAPLPGDGVKGAKAKPKKRVTGKDDGEGDKEAPEEDTRPWIVRNWMIAVPLGVVAFNVLTAVAAPQEGQGQGQAPAPQRRR